ncbi:MAG: LPS-assembly protein LptD [Spirochaetaceae bacterium]|jgi:lipopolysaccharide assembly outer membrane protein LptD (OstA)|nr:LPS-assembly protein LptD [Spirochaetaceae bacterium]
MFFLWCIPALAAQEMNIDHSILELDIKTSSLTELAVWCRSLGLSEAGTKYDLAQRLRNYYQLPPPDTQAVSANQRTITIESARSSEYFTIEVVQEDYARFIGSVVISLNDGDTTHRISADEILYNRTRNLMTATGNVDYISQTGDSVQTFRGESITIDMDTWETVLLDGVSEMSMSGDTTTYRFSGTVMSHPSSSVTILTDADISKANKPEALWSIHASKIWLLPGSDFAIFNAVLKVGEIPVFYLPFLHWPADEIIFHPVIGFRSREGNFVQTTTYIWGRPKATGTSESSITTVMQGATDQERRREGIFLRSTGKKATDPNDKRLSVLFDFYANLGAYVGAELELPKKDSRGAITVSGGLGFSRDIYSYDSGYSPYDGAGEDHWNTSYFLFNEVPFRYRFNATGSYSWKYSNITWAIPFYSDPFVNQDFIQNRSETMDLFNTLKNGAGGSDTTSSTSSTTISSYQMQVNATISPVVTRFNPYITNLSVSNLSTVMSFKSRNTNSAYYRSTVPSFFYPDKYTIYSISATLGGTPFTYSLQEQRVQNSLPKEQETLPEDPLKDIGVPIVPWEPVQNPEAKNITSKDMRLVPPVLATRFDLPQANGLPRFTIDYRFNPSLSSELQFSNGAWMEAAAIDLNQVSSVLSSFKSDATINFAFAQTEGLNYSTFFQLAQNSAVQEYSYLNEEEYTDSESIRERAYNASFFSSTWEFGAGIKPFYRSSVWSNSNFQYNIKGVLAKTIFSGTGLEPHWDIEGSQWNKDYFDNHQFSVNLAASVMDLSQNLNIAMDMPPEDSAITANATVRIWRSETTLSGKINNPGPEQIFDLFTLKETFTFDTARSGSLQASLIYDPEKEELRSVSSNIAWNGISASFVASYLKSYELDAEMGWFIPADAEEKMQPSTFSLEYNKTFKHDSLEQNNLSFSLSLHPTLTFNLQRYTYSRFSFVLGFTMKIRDFLDITFSSTSENTVVFRYFQDVPFFDLPIELPGEKNFFIDLLNSFRFDNEMIRRNSGFKLKSFDLHLVHHLGDWDASLGIKLSPYLDGRVYQFNNQVSFVVQWSPLAEIKTEIQHDKDTWIFK